MGDILLIILSFILVLGGLLGVLLPVIPAVPLSWLGLLLFSYVTGFAAISLKTVLIFLILTVLTVVLDIVAPILGAKKYKATNVGVAGSFIGSILGFFLLGPLGIITGPIIGAFLGEYISGRETQHAWHSAIGTAMGILIGGLIKVTLILVILGVMVVAIF